MPRGACLAVSDINIHFSRQEFAERQRRARERMAALELDGMLLFKFEDMYWLSGFDSDGFTIFGCMFLGTEGQLTHLARPADLGNAAYSSICEDIRVAPDSQDAPRAGQIREMLQSLGMQGKRIGIQVDTGAIWLLHRTLFESCAWSRAHKSSSTCVKRVKSWTW